MYSSNTTCTVVVDFKPQTVGLRLGAVQLYSDSTLIATAPVYGVGSGPLAQFPSGGAQSSIGSSLSFADAVAVNDVGDIFVSEASGLFGSIVEIAPDGTAQTLVSGIPSPSFGIAVDGAGNLFVTDAGDILNPNAGIVAEVTASGGTFGPSSTVTTVAQKSERSRWAGRRCGRQPVRR
uniref:NHL repeat protein n=1 Tax=Acidobacterium capsulatum TaxID=33075 RepID=A0A7V4XSE5_9BACT